MLIAKAAATTPAREHVAHCDNHARSRRVVRSLNGDCQPDGTCVCYPGFRGESCSVECPGGNENECNGFGVCNSEGTCECFHGYRTSDCSKECPGGLQGYLDGQPVVVRECSGERCARFDYPLKRRAPLQNQSFDADLMRLIKAMVSAKTTARANAIPALDALTAPWSRPI